MIKQSDVLILGAPRLKQRAHEVKDPASCADLVTRMREIMYGHEGLGLAAPQIGEMSRVFVWRVEGREGAIINPVLTLSGETVTGTEGCLSIPGMIGEVPRCETVTVEGYDEYGQPLRITASGMLARVLQHENDHLDGVLFIDHVLPGTLQPVPMNQIPNI